MRSDAILSRQTNEIGNQKNKVLTASFHVHERPDSNCSASVSESSRRSEVAETVVTEPHENIAEEHNAKAASCVLVDARGVHCVLNLQHLCVISFSSHSVSKHSCWTFGV